MSITPLVEIKPNPNIPELAPGDTVKVSTKVVEGGRERLQLFQGIVIKVQRGGISASFTVRRIAYGVGVERTFPLHSPLVEKVEVIRHGKVRRARLYYLRGRSGKAARLKERRVAKGKLVKPEPVPSVQAEEELEPVQQIETEVEPEPVEAQSELVQQEEPEEAQKIPPKAEAELETSTEPESAQQVETEAELETKAEAEPKPEKTQSELVQQEEAENKPEE